MIELSDKSAELHDKSIVVAFHTDYILDVQEMRFIGQRKVMQRHIPRLRKGGINAIGEHLGGDDVLHAYPLPINTHVSTMRPSYSKTAFRGIDYMLSEISEHDDNLTLATTAEEVIRAKKEGKIAMIFCLEGGEPLEDDLCLMRTYYRLGVRCIGLSHNLRNTLVDGVMVRSNSGLSDWGVEVVEEMNRLGIIVDVSHVSYQGILDAIEVSKDPVIASHSNAYSICNNVRNLKDEQIHALAESGGVIGIHFLSSFISEKPRSTLDDVLNHIDYIGDLVGVDHVGLGPDRGPEAWNPRREEDPFYGLYYMDKMERIFPKTSLKYEWIYPKGCEDIDKLPRITEGLLSRGYSDQEIEKVLGKNWLRVFKKVWGK